jgi:hypothetical protein
VIREVDDTVASGLAFLPLVRQTEVLSDPM